MDISLIFSQHLKRIWRNLNTSTLFLLNSHTNLINLTFWNFHLILVHIITNILSTQDIHINISDLHKIIILLFYLYVLGESDVQFDSIFLLLGVDEDAGWRSWVYWYVCGLDCDDDE